MDAPARLEAYYARNNIHDERPTHTGLLGTVQQDKTRQDKCTTELACTDTSFRQGSIKSISLWSNKHTSRSTPSYMQRCYKVNKTDQALPLRTKHHL